MTVTVRFPAEGEQRDQLMGLHAYFVIGGDQQDAKKSMEDAYRERDVLKKLYAVSVPYDETNAQGAVVFRGRELAPGAQSLTFDGAEWDLIKKYLDNMLRVAKTSSVMQVDNVIAWVNGWASDPANDSTDRKKGRRKAA